MTLIRALRWDDCRDLDGPSGDFSVMTFFNPDGTVREARFDAHGYLRADGRMIPVPVSTALTGTPRGDCVLAHFAAVKIPPFEGAPFAVRLNFILD